jgi:hypothetical protein
MSADVLRRAAALMRERAAGATAVWGAERWKAFHAEHPYSNGVRTPDLDRHYVGTDDEHGSILLSSGWDETQIVDHAASWHPAVALKVAAWLDSEAAVVELDGGRPVLLSPQALAVARAYLGEGADQ